MEKIKIALLSDSKQSLGGAWSFMSNISKGLKALGHDIVEPQDAEIALISGVTMVNRVTVTNLKERGVKVVTRVDNVPRNSRNRNTGTSRLKDYTKWADEVVYQCKWARFYLRDFIGRAGVIIYNSVDEKIFKPEGFKVDYKKDESKPIYLYSRFNRDETKNWEVAWYEYQLINRKNPRAKLVLIGKFSPEQHEYNYDFFRGEKIEKPYVIDQPEMMAEVYRGCDYMLATYYNDCFSNTYLEFLMTKNENKLIKVNMSGGTPEMLELWKNHGRDYFKLERMAKEYEEVFKKLL